MLSMPNAPQFAVPTVPRAGMAQAATATPAADPRQEYLDQQAARRAVSQPATSRREIADAASPASVVFVPYTGEESSSGGVGLLPLLAGGLIAYSLLKGK
jgi:hypothetical protein